MDKQKKLLRLLFLGISVLFLSQSLAWCAGLSWGPVVTESDVGVCVPDENPVISPGPMKSPLRLYEENENTLLVSDRGGSIYKINKAAPTEPEKLFEINGSPLGVAVYGERVLVGNESTGKVESYLLRGDRVLKRGAFPRAKKQTIQPLDIDVDASQALFFVLDGKDRHVKVYNRRGRQVQSIGNFGQLVFPQAIDLNPMTKELFVSDYGDQSMGISASIEVFDYSGRHLKTITGSFSRPQGVLSSNQSVFVVDAVLGQVLELDRESGSKVASYGCFGSSEGHLMLPMDVSFDSQLQKIFVADNRNGRVTVLPSGVQ